MELVEIVEEDLRTRIATLVLKGPQHARAYNDLLNRSKKLNQVVPMKMNKRLYIIKFKKMDQIKEEIFEIMRLDGHMKHLVPK